MIQVNTTPRRPQAQATSACDRAPIHTRQARRRRGRRGGTERAGKPGSLRMRCRRRRCSPRQADGFSQLAVVVVAPRGTVRSASQTRCWNGVPRKSSGTSSTGAPSITYARMRGKNVVATALGDWLGVGPFLPQARGQGRDRRYPGHRGRRSRLSVAARKSRPMGIHPSRSRFVSEAGRAHQAGISCRRDSQPRGRRRRQGRGRDFRQRITAWPAIGTAIDPRRPHADDRNHDAGLQIGVHADSVHAPPKRASVFTRFRRRRRQDESAGRWAC